MPVYQTKNKQDIEQYLLRNANVNFYHIGDLDDFFWSHTTWYVNKEGSDFSALLLQYDGIDPIVLLAIENNNPLEMKQLINEVMPDLPPKFYSHLSPGYELLFADKFNVEDHGIYLMMEWRHKEFVSGINTDKVVLLSSDDIQDLTILYEKAYPGNWFDARMLETKQYVGIRDDKKGLIIGVAGIHVYSEAYQVAALGNITVDPDFRGQGYGKKLTAGLCKKLTKTVKFIGLNVKADNIPAITAYEKCGFEIAAKYGEWMLTEK